LKKANEKRLKKVENQMKLRLVSGFPITTKVLVC